MAHRSVDFHKFKVFVQLLTLLFLATFTHNHVQNFTNITSVYITLTSLALVSVELF